MTGTDCIQYYSLDIFQKANLSVDKYLLAVILQGSWTIGYALASVGMARVGRRKQFLISGMMLAPCLALLGLSVFLQVLVTNLTTYKIHSEEYSFSVSRLGVPSAAILFPLPDCRRVLQLLTRLWSSCVWPGGRAIQAKGQRTIFSYCSLYQVRESS